MCVCVCMNVCIHMYGGDGSSITNLELLFVAACF